MRCCTTRYVLFFLSGCADEAGHNKFEQLLQTHLKEMFPIIYTPTEGDAIQNYSRLFRKPEGCFLNIRDQGSIDECLSNFGSEEDVDYIVVSDGEEVRQSADLQLQRLTPCRSSESEIKVSVRSSSQWPSWSSPHFVPAFIRHASCRWCLIAEQTYESLLPR